MDVHRGVVVQRVRDDRDAAVATLTGRQLFPRFAAPDEVAGLIAYLVGPDSSFITGAVIDVDAGHTAS